MATGHRSFKGLEVACLRDSEGTSLPIQVWSKTLTSRPLQILTHGEIDWTSSIPGLMYLRDNLWSSTKRLNLSSSWDDLRRFAELRISFKLAPPSRNIFLAGRCLCAARSSKIKHFPDIFNISRTGLQPTLPLVLIELIFWAGTGPLQKFVVPAIVLTIIITFKRRTEKDWMKFHSYLFKT